MCPQNPTRIILSGEFANPDYMPDAATATDAVDSNPVVTTEPAVVSGLTARNVSQFIVFTARATDADGNEATCQYTLQVEGTHCANKKHIHLSIHRDIQKLLHRKLCKNESKMLNCYGHM